MNSGVLPVGISYVSADAVRAKQNKEIAERPEWLTSSPDEVAEFLACIAEIESAGSALHATYNRKTLANIKRILASERSTQLGPQTVAYLIKMRQEVWPTVQERLKNRIIVDVAINTLENSLSQIRHAVSNLERQKAAQLHLLAKHLAEVDGGLRLEDFVERALQMYCQHSEMSLGDIFSLFGSKVERFDQIPHQYKVNVWSGSLCARCDERIYVGDIENLRRTGSVSRFCCDCSETSGEIEKAIPFWKAMELAFPSTPLKNPLRDIRQEELNAMAYKEYLRTDEWAEIRKKALKDGGYMCRICGERKNLHVHHNFIRFFAGRSYLGTCVYFVRIVIKPITTP